MGHRRQRELCMSDFGASEGISLFSLREALRDSQNQRRGQRDQDRKPSQNFPRLS